MRKGVDCRGNQWEERQLFGKMIDITGKHFERLTVLFPVNSNNKKKWLCQCSCGNEVVVGYNNLTMNNTKSCGCLQKDIASKNWEEYRNNKNYIGQQFGRLTVVEFVNVEKNEAIYRFRCTCGNIIETSLHSVKEGNTKSCGCLKKDYINSYKTDIIGKKFGHLLVQSYVGINAYGNSDFKCLCDCGETVIVSRNSLLTKHTQSCGCARYPTVDLTGKKFNHLTVISFSHSTSHKVFWNCLCDCGKATVVRGDYLKKWKNYLLWLCYTGNSGGWQNKTKESLC